jgi:hypothetical protein
VDVSIIASTWRKHHAIVTFGVGLIAGVTSATTAYKMFGMHRGDFSVPVMSEDGLTIYSVVKAMQQHGWFTPNPSLGYPAGQDFAPYPNLDLVNLLWLKLFSLFSQNPYTPVSVFNLWVFFLIGAIGFWVMRYVGVRTLIAFPLAIATSLAPWHFQRIAGHLFLANYSTLFVGLFIAIYALRRIRDDPARGTRSRIVGDFAVLATTGFYVAGGGLYWIFACIAMIALTLVPALLTHRTWRGVAYTAGALLPIAAFAGAWLSYQTWSSQYPIVVKSFKRELIESELYGGSITTLFLASPHSGITRFTISRDYYDSLTRIANNWESGPWNGIVGVVAVAVSCLCILATVSTLWSPRDGQRTTSFRFLHTALDRTREEGWFALFLAAFLMFAVTGLGTLTMIFAFQEIRAWGRFFILVVIIATIILGLVLTHLTRRNRVVALVVALLIAAVFTVDQVRGDYRLDFTSTAKIAADARVFDNAIENSVAPNCPLLTLPVMPFPENGPIGGMLDYDPLWLYVESNDLRFTYGIPKNQPEAAWQAQFAQPLNPTLIQTARDAGICGITIDTFGYGGPDASDVATMRFMVGTQPIWSPSRRWLFLPI